eukprot:m.165589 g.165589  ORF g.165589 m.165589 type:complete len:81 (-) comp12581_c0_seq1:104-346(-)
MATQAVPISSLLLFPHAPVTGSVTLMLPLFKMPQVSILRFSSWASRHFLSRYVTHHQLLVGGWQIACFPATTTSSRTCCS